MVFLDLLQVFVFMKLVSTAYASVVNHMVCWRIPIWWDVPSYIHYVWRFPSKKTMKSALYR